VSSISAEVRPRTARKHRSSRRIDRGESVTSLLPGSRTEKRPGVFASVCNSIFCAGRVCRQTGAVAQVEAILDQGRGKVGSSLGSPRCSPRCAKSFISATPAGGHTRRPAPRQSLAFVDRWTGGSTTLGKGSPERSSALRAGVSICPRKPAFRPTRGRWWRAPALRWSATRATERPNRSKFRPWGPR